MYRGYHEKSRMVGHRKEAAGADRRGRYVLTSKSHKKVYFGRATPRNGRLFQIKLFCILKEIKEVMGTKEIEQR